MSIVIKSQRDIALMRQAGRIAAGARSIARQMIAPGITTKAINKEVFNFIRKSGAEPTFLGYNGYPASACTVSSATPTTMMIEVPPREMPLVRATLLQWLMR